MPETASVDGGTRINALYRLTATGRNSFLRYLPPE